MNCDHEHDHDHAHHDHGRMGAASHRASRRLLIALVVIVVFMAVEVVGALISGSLALLADAAHMFTDAFALGLALFAQRVATRPADASLHYGYSRAQVLAAFANGVMLFAVIFFLALEALRRVFAPVEIDWRPMLAVAVAGFAANAVAFFLLHGADARNLNVRGALLHVVSDLLGSVAAIVAALVIMAGGPTQVDALLSMLVVALIGRSAWKLVKETGHILLQGAPKNLNVEAMTQDLRGVDDEILDVHDVKVWQLTPDESRVTLHVRIRDRERAQAALDKIKARLQTQFGIRQSTVQIELGDVCPDAGIETNEADAAAPGHAPVHASIEDKVVAWLGPRRTTDSPVAPDAGAKVADLNPPLRAAP